jgi:flagellar biosynthesis anti-sigma factor FlgM
MKIDSNRPNLDHAALQRLEKAAAEASKQSAAAKTATGDTVQLSADAALANDAVKAANESPDIRTDLVERMRALLAAGELGSDAGSLADSLIDSMLDKTGGTDKK